MSSENVDRYAVTRPAAPQKKLQQVFADMLLLIVDEASMLSLAENGRLVDAVRTGKSSDEPLGDAAIIYLGDFGTPVGWREHYAPGLLPAALHHCHTTSRSSPIPPRGNGVLVVRSEL